MSTSNLNLHGSHNYIDSHLLYRDATSAQDVSQVIGRRGGRLLEAIRTYYGWEQEDLQRELEHTEHRIYAVSTINTWEITDNISQPGANVLGSLFKLDADLFYGHSEKTCQSWTPPSFQKRENPPVKASSESVQQRLDTVRKQFQRGLPDDLVGLRGGLLLRAIRISYLEWNPEELKRQIERIAHKRVAAGTISGWESTGVVSVDGATILGSLFGIDPCLFNPRAGSEVRGPKDVVHQTVRSPLLRTFPPSFQQQSSLPSSEQERAIEERISNTASQHLQENAPPSQTPESSENSTEVQGLKRKRSWQGAEVHRSEGVSQHLQEGTPSSQTQESSPVPVRSPHYESLEGEAPDPFAFSPGDDLFAGFDL
jgi:hypothetical protein